VARNRAAGEPFRFYEWDAENFLFSVNSNRTGVSNASTPGELYNRLRQNDEFNLRFADRVQAHMFNGGALTVEEATARFQHIVDEIRPALNAEAARWGDELQEPAHNSFDDFDAVVAEKLNNYFPDRTGIVLNQLLAAGLYTNTVAPSFNQHGGQVASGFDLTMSAPSGTIYYTVDGSDPREVGGAVSGSAIQYAGSPIDITAATTVLTRSLDGSDWSAVNEAVFVVVPFADATSLRITELHYNPVEPNAAEIAAGFTDGDEFEFIELLNISAEPIELQNSTLLGAVGFTFSDSAELSPGERVVVVENQAAFEHRYGTSIRIVGQWTDKLSNSGETLTLNDAVGQPIHSFTYEDGDDPGEEAWPTAPDGNGPTLVVVDTEGNYNDGVNWRASSTIHGTPGAVEVTVAGDFDGDGDVDAGDLVDWQSGYGTSSGALPSDGDANADGDVDGFDYLRWQQNFTGASVGSALARVSTPATTLEPSMPELFNPQNQRQTALDRALAGLQWTALSEDDDPAEYDPADGDAGAGNSPNHWTLSWLGAHPAWAVPREHRPVEHHLITREYSIPEAVADVALGGLWEDSLERAGATGRS
jgi:hypothetical protein